MSPQGKVTWLCGSCTTSSRRLWLQRAISNVSLLIFSHPHQDSKPPHFQHQLEWLSSPGTSTSAIASCPQTPWLRKQFSSRIIHHFEAIWCRQRNYYHPYKSCHNGDDEPLEGCCLLEIIGREKGNVKMWERLVGRGIEVHPTSSGLIYLGIWSICWHCWWYSFYVKREAGPVMIEGNQLLQLPKAEVWLPNNCHFRQSRVNYQIQCWPPKICAWHTRLEEAGCLSRSCKILSGWWVSPCQLSISFKQTHHHPF